MYIKILASFLLLAITTCISGHTVQPSTRITLKETVPTIISVEGCYNINQEEANDVWIYLQQEGKLVTIYDPYMFVIGYGCICTDTSELLLVFPATYEVLAFTLPQLTGTLTHPLDGYGGAISDESAERVHPFLSSVNVLYHATLRREE